MDLRLKHPNQGADTADVFEALYKNTASPGAITRWDQWMLENYTDASGHVLMLNMLLTSAMEHRKNDAVWRAAVWNDDTLSQNVLRTNLRNRTRFAPALRLLLAPKYSFLSMMTPRDADTLALRLSGPWALAMQWRDDVLEGRLQAKNDHSQHSWWMYCERENENHSGQKKAEVKTLLGHYSHSLCGALALYIGVDNNMQYRAHMADIFKMPVPTSDTSLFFIGLTYLYENYQSAPEGNHVWLVAQQSWPEPCRMLEMFVSLYPDMQTARESMGILGDSFEQRYASSIELPVLEPLAGQEP